MGRTYIDITPPEIVHREDFIDMISFIVCKVCDIDSGNLPSDSRKHHVALARGLFIHFAYLYTDTSYRVLGELTNRKETSCRDWYITIKEMVLCHDRRAYSLYIKIKEEIDLYIKTIYPATFELRVSRFETFTSVTTEI